MDHNLGQVVLVNDINPGRDSSLFYSEFAEFNGKLYFAANDGTLGSELYVTDGTTEGTQLLADIRPEDNRSNYFPGNSFPRNFTEFNGKLYFTAVGETRPGGEQIGRELYVTDGTSEGTQLVKDIFPGTFSTRAAYSVNSSSPDNFTEFNDKLYFSASSQDGRELFVTDGTTEGTQLVADIFPGIYRSIFSINYDSAYDSSPRYITELNDKLYFTADDGESGRELYVTDGTTEGTQLVKDIFPGSEVLSTRDFSGNPRTVQSSSSPRYITELNDKLYFTATDGESGSELYVTDGTAEGTQLVKDINPGSDSSINPEDRPNFTKFNGKLYFTADDGTSGSELFVTDGTTKGTNLVKDINPGSGSSSVVVEETDFLDRTTSFYDSPNFTEFNGRLYFRANDGTSGSELFVTDGTAEGTKLVADINQGSGSSLIVGEETYLGRTFIDDRPTFIDDRPNFTEFNDKLYFRANDGTSGEELYVTDGTTEGTKLVADINSGSGSSYPSSLTVFGNELFFNANDGTSGRELFKLTFDGTVTQSLNPISGTANNDNLVGTDGDDEISGNGSNDGITGESGNDMLAGNSGNDVLDGGAGDDTLDGGEGTDTAVYQFAPAAVTVALGEPEMGGTASDGDGGTDSLFNLENAIGSEFDDNLTANSGNNSLTGRGGNDAIAGGSGDDFLTGSTGADILTGGEGSDQFVYLNPNEGGDTITDFVVGTDKIAAVASGFGGELSAGELPESSFVMGSAATNSEQRFVFNDASSELFFDADGSGAASQQLIATLDGVSNLSAGDILLL